MRYPQDSRKGRAGCGWVRDGPLKFSDTRNVAGSIRVVSHVATTQDRLNPSHAARLVVRRPLVKIKLLFLLASFISLVLSVSLYFGGHEQQGIFVGIWVPSILSLGALLLAGEDGEAR